MTLRPALPRVALAALLVSSPLGAQTAPSASASAPAAPGPTPAEKEARELFLKGTELMQAGDVDGALLRFLDSRSRFRSFANTANAAVCLERLGRFDEALDMYRELVADFSPKFQEDERKSVAAQMAGLRKKVTTLDVAANIDGTLVIDGKNRGNLPLFGPVSMLPGRHKVLVFKEGYASAEADIETRVGETHSIELKLSPLTDVGRLSVREQDDTEGLEVLVDGAPVGKTPWKGTLSKGPHLLSLRGKDAGTGPTRVTVVVGQELAQVLKAEPLGAEITLAPTPRSALLSIDGVAVGQGTWVGRLPRKTHTVAASEEGYLEQSAVLEPDARGVLEVTLVVDRRHPRWPREPSGSFTAGVVALAGVSSSLNSDIERNCGAGCSGGPPLTAAGMARGGYAFLNGWRAEASFGVATFQRRVARSFDAGGYTLETTDPLRARGMAAFLGGGYAVKASPRVDLVPRLAVGVGFFSSSNDAEIEAIKGQDRARMVVDQGGAAVSNNPLLLMPSIEAEIRLGRVWLVAGLAAPMILTSGPKLPNGEAAVPLQQARSCKAEQAACVPGTNRLSGETAYRAALFLAPTLGATYRF